MRIEGDRAGPDGEARVARMSGGQRRQQFVDVAARLVAEHGVDAVTMESVAAAAGVSKGLGYAYFANRSELLLAVLARETERLERAVADAVASSDDFETRVRAAVGAWLDAVEDRGSLLVTLLVAGQIQSSLQGRRHLFYRGVEEMWGEIAAREFRIPVERAVTAAAILVAGLRGLVERWDLDPQGRPMLEDTFVAVTMGSLARLAAEYGGVHTAPRSGGHAVQP
ncbi:MAG TPA: TetR/AcrR family transcriptional regulator [Acidimicrobiales bacterium]|nr:TetR/AcrR family transcriptional regulator [Acidimicrobiales bacterium]